MASANDRERIRLFVMDVDGVLTDGSIYVHDDGREFKRFHVYDGFALRLAEKAGLVTAIITGRRTDAVLHRASDLRIAHVYQHSKDKRADLRDLVEKTGIPLSQTAVIGDDWPDMGILAMAGHSFAPSTARPEVKKVVRQVLAMPGGQGCVREAIEVILKHNGVLEGLLASYHGDDVSQKKQPPV